MLRWLKNNTIYKNRKELRDIIGISEYKRECMRGNIEFLNEDGVHKSAMMRFKDTWRNK